MTCVHCESWGCTRCKPMHEVAASTRGEGGLTEAELEVVALRNRVAELEVERKPRRFPLQADRPDRAAPGPFEIPWSVAEIAYGAYAAKYGRSQSLERLAERGGFGWSEMDRFHPAWRTEVVEIDRLRALLADCRAWMTGVTLSALGERFDPQTYADRVALIARIDEVLP